MLLSPPVPVPAPRAPRAETVLIPAPLLGRFLATASEVQARGFKSFGLLVADPRSAGFPYTASDVVFFDPTRNRRNAPEFRSAFEAQGTYFREYEDAGFVADPADVLQAVRRLDELGLEPVAMFHTHRRQPANFSRVDYRLHNPAYPWHLIVSFAESDEPVVRAFGVQKAVWDFGINAGDHNEGSETSYSGPEVVRLDVAV